MTVDLPLPAHSLLGASAMHRWMHCPGSFALSQDGPPGRSSIYAATGTLAHSFIEGTLRETLKAEGHLDPAMMRLDEILIGATYQVEGHDIVIDEDFLFGVNTMLEYLAQTAPAYDMVQCERTVHLDSYFTRPPPVRMFGRTDVVMYGEPILEIVDYKNGSGVIVDPEDNPQMLYYAAGVVADLARVAPKRDVHTVKLTVVQPHARSIAKVRSSTIDFVDLMMWVDDVLIPAVDACRKYDAPLVTGSWCRFCPVSFRCPTLLEEANHMAKLEFDDARIPDDLNELSAQLDIADRAAIWIDAIRAKALERLQRQERIPNWTLTPTRPVRRWRDEDQVEHMLIHAMHLSPGDTHRSDLKSPAQIEKLVQKKVSRSAWEQNLAPLVESHSSGVKLLRQGSDDWPDPC